MDDAQSQEPAEQVGRPRAPQRRSPSSAQPGHTPAPDSDPTPDGEPSAQAMALRARRPPRAGTTRGAGATPRAGAGATDRPHLPRGAGEHFQPVPHALLVAPYEDRDGPSATVPAPAGTPVHAVCAGTVREADAGVLRIAGDDGFTWEYTGVGDVRVPQGQRVDAGGIIAVLGGGSGPRQALRLSVVDRHGAPARLHEVLRGAVDPNDLGYGATGTGVDIDPDADVAPRSTPVPAPAPVRAAPAPPRPSAEALKPPPAPPRPSAEALKPPPAPPRPSAEALKPPPAPPRVVPASADGGLQPPPAPPRPAPRPRRGSPRVEPEPAPVAAEPEPAPVAAEPEFGSAPASTADHPAASEPVGAVEPPVQAHPDAIAPEAGGSSGAAADAPPHDAPPEPPADDKRRRAAMLIANRRRRPKDQGSSS